MVFPGKFREIPNLHQLDNTTKGIKCKYLFSLFLLPFAVSLIGEIDFIKSAFCER